MWEAIARTILVYAILNIVLAKYVTYSMQVGRRPILPVALRDLPWDPIRGSVDDLMAGFTGTLSAETKVALQSRRVHVMTVRHVQSVVIYILLPRRMPMAFSHT